MARSLVFWALLVGWFALMALSYLLPANTAPTDFGLTRGLNRITLFFQVQVAAAVIAAILWWMAKTLAPGWQRWLARVPGLVALLLMLAVIGLILWTNLGKPPASDYLPDPDRPVTAPATDLTPSDG